MNTVKGILRLHVMTSQIVEKVFSELAKQENENFDGEDLKAIADVSQAVNIALVPAVLHSMARLIEEKVWVLDDNPAEQLKGLAVAYMEQVGTLLGELADALPSDVAGTSGQRSGGVAAS